MLGGGASLGAIQVGVLQALSEHDVAPDLVAGTSVGSLNGAALARDPTSGPNRLSHVWARMTTAQIFPGGLLAQVRTLQRTKTHLFPNDRSPRCDRAVPRHRLLMERLAVCRTHRRSSSVRDL